jgi:predicted DNA-binding transcriptional regulator AlpA
MRALPAHEARSFESAEHTNDAGCLLLAEEVALLLSVPRSWVYSETRADRLPHVKLGRYYRYSEPSIRAFIAGLERGPIPYRKYLAHGRPLGRNGAR